MQGILPKIYLLLIEPAVELKIKPDASIPKFTQLGSPFLTNLRNMAASSIPGAAARFFISTRRIPDRGKDSRRVGWEKQGRSGNRVPFFCTEAHL